jgi:hypothetical protein
MAQGFLVGLPQRLFDADGVPAAGWTVETFTATGTFAVPLITYSDATLLSSNGASVTTDASGYYRMFLSAGVLVDIRVKNASAVTQFTMLSVEPQAVGVAAGGTITSPIITSPTLSSITNLDKRVLAADATAASNATLASLTGFSWTLTAAGTYAFRIGGKVGMTTNGGLAMAFKYTTLTLTSIIVNATQRTASVFALTQSTTTTDQTKFIDQKAVVYIHVELAGSLIVNAGGTLAVQFAQNTSHIDTTTVFKGFVGEFVRTS